MPHTREEAESTEPMSVRGIGVLLELTGDVMSEPKREEGDMRYFAEPRPEFEGVFPPLAMPGQQPASPTPPEPEQPLGQ